jgi:hypothetical protein
LRRRVDILVGARSVAETPMKRSTWLPLSSVLGFVFVFMAIEAVASETKQYDLSQEFDAADTTIHLDMDGGVITGSVDGPTGVSYTSRGTAGFDNLAVLGTSFLPEILSDAAGTE